MNGERSTVYNEAGERYKGSWKGNKRHGKGVFFYKSGNRYEGEWKDDRRHGLGTLYILEHEESKLRVSYSGNWVNDKPSGMGVFYNEKGECVQRFEHFAVQVGKVELTTILVSGPRRPLIIPFVADAPSARSYRVRKCSWERCSA